MRVVKQPQRLCPQAMNDHKTTRADVDADRMQSTARRYFFSNRLNDTLSVRGVVPWHEHCCELESDAFRNTEASQCKIIRQGRV